jgi:hypothetical protein
MRPKQIFFVAISGHSSPGWLKLDPIFKKRRFGKWSGLFAASFLSSDIVSAIGIVLISSHSCQMQTGNCKNTN